MNAKLAIAIPTYNRAAILDDILWNLGPQIQRAGEEVVLYVIDNDSTDDTAGVVQRHAERWRGIHYVKNAENVGLIRNIGEALRVPEATWIWLMGDDDVPAPWSVSQILADLETLVRPESVAFLLLNGAKVDEQRNFCPESWQHVEGYSQELTRFEKGSEIIRVGGIHCLAWLSKLVVQRRHWDHAYFESIYRASDLYTFVHVLLRTATTTATVYSKRLSVFATDRGSRSYYHAKTAIARICEFPEIERLIVASHGRKEGTQLLHWERKAWFNERVYFALKIAVFDEDYAQQIPLLKTPVSPYPLERYCLRGIYLLTRVPWVKAALRAIYLRRRGKNFSADSINQAT